MPQSTNWKQVVIFSLIMTAIYILLMPVFMNHVLFRYLFPELFVPNSIGILRWDIALQNQQMIVVMIFFYLAFMVAIFSSSFKGKKDVGTEHGSARFLSDKEFDALVPNYVFHKDEYNYRRNDGENMKMVYLKESNKDIFEDLELTEVLTDE